MPADWYAGIDKCIFLNVTKYLSDVDYIDELVARGRAFTYRTARGRDPFDPVAEASRDKWIEWLAEAEATVTRLARSDSEAVRQIRRAKHLEVVGELGSEFYESREAAINALLLCIAGRLPTVAQSSDHHISTREDRTFWERYGREILIGVVVTVLGGIILTFIL